MSSGVGGGVLFEHARADFVKLNLKRKAATRLNDLGLDHVGFSQNRLLER